MVSYGSGGFKIVNPFAYQLTKQYAKQDIKPIDITLLGPFSIHAMAMGMYMIAQFGDVLIGLQQGKASGLGSIWLIGAN